MRFNISVQRLDSLIGRLRQCFETFPDKRRGMNITYSMADIAMAAFSVFFMQSPSFLAYQRHLQEGHGRSNCEGLFGISKIPSDNHIRDMLDPADPALLYPMFAEVLRELEQSGGLSAFRRLGNHVLIALDGSEYFCSNKISCPHCSTRLRGAGKGKDNSKGKAKDNDTTEITADARPRASHLSRQCRCIRNELEQGWTAKAIFDRHHATLGTMSYRQFMRHVLAELGPDVGRSALAPSPVTSGLNSH